MAFEIFRYFSNCFKSSWDTPGEGEETTTQLKVWRLAISGLNRKQCMAALKLIVEGKTEFQKFPPNPQEFRDLCLNMGEQDPSHVPFKALGHNHVNDTSSDRYLEFKRWREGYGL